jgi:hypothetical protein
MNKARKEEGKISPSVATCRNLGRDVKYATEEMTFILVAKTILVYTPYSTRLTLEVQVLLLQPRLLSGKAETNTKDTRKMITQKG